MNHIIDLEETLSALRTYKMKPNLTKYAHKVILKKFLGFMVSRRGIKANTEKIRAIKEMIAPRTIKEVQRLIEKVVALNHFNSRSIERCMSIF